MVLKQDVLPEPSSNRRYWSFVCCLSMSRLDLTIWKWRAYFVRIHERKVQNAIKFDVGWYVEGYIRVFGSSHNITARKASLVFRTLKRKHQYQKEKEKDIPSNFADCSVQQTETLKIIKTNHVSGMFFWGSNWTELKFPTPAQPKAWNRKELLWSGLSQDQSNPGLIRLSVGHPKHIS